MESQEKDYYIKDCGKRGKVKVYYEHSYPYDDGSKKRGRKTKEEKEEYNKTQQLKYTIKTTILTFD